MRVGSEPPTKGPARRAFRPSPEQREDGEHAAVVVLGVRKVELLEDPLHVPLDGPGAHEELLADGAVGAALGDQREHLALTVGEVVEGRAAMPADEPLHDLGVERRPTRGDALDGVDELGGVSHPILQQVTDAGRVVADELEHVRGLEVLRQHQHGDVRVRAADGCGSDEPVVGVVGWHPDVDHGDVGGVRAHLQEEIVGVRAAPDDLVAGVLEQRCDAVSKEHLVVRNDDAKCARGGFRVIGVRCSVPCGHGGSRWCDVVTVDASALQHVEHEIARILSETDRPVEVYEASLEAIGTAIGWELGAVWEVGPDDDRLRCVRTWQASHGPPEFRELSERIVLMPGEGLPGRVLAHGDATWVVDVPTDSNFPRAQAAARTGLHAAFGFPLRSPHGIVGVMEFFAREERPPDARLLATMQVLGSQVGQFVARRRAEEAVRANESRLRAMLESALDAVVSMDDGGRVVGWNHAAQEIFGFTAEEAIGEEMAELIVPDSLRAAHRAGLARYLETDTPVILDRRLEITGRRKDGTELPVELTITRVALPGRPQFTGYLRDITERKRAQDALLASRARLVEVADAERQRIQRNLHDGAQQRLTAVLLTLGRIRDASGQGDERLELAIEELAAGLQDLRDLASGLHPSVLAERGLVAALEALVIRAPLPVELHASVEAALPEQVEAAAYYVVAESLANVQKHANAETVEVRAALDGDTLVVEVADDGAGGADAEGGGLRGLADRVEAIGGTLAIESPPGSGTRLVARLPTG